MTKQEKFLNRLVNATSFYIDDVKEILGFDNGFSDVTLEPTEDREFETSLKIELIFTVKRLQRQLDAYMTAQEKLNLKD